MVRGTGNCSPRIGSAISRRPSLSRLLKNSTLHLVVGGATLQPCYKCPTFSVGFRNTCAQTAAQRFFFRTSRCRLGALLASTKLTSFSRSSTTSRAADSQRLFWAEFAFHLEIMLRNPSEEWSILTSRSPEC